MASLSLVTGENSALSICLYPGTSSWQLPIETIQPRNVETAHYKLIKRNHQCQNTYKAERENNYEAGLEYCEELLPFHSEYFATIQHLRKLSIQAQALRWSQECYEKRWDEGSFDWAQAGLANSLWNLGQFNEAQRMIESLIWSFTQAPYIGGPSCSSQPDQQQSPNGHCSLQVSEWVTPEIQRESPWSPTFVYRWMTLKPRYATIRTMCRLIGHLSRQLVYEAKSYSILLYCASDGFDKQSGNLIQLITWFRKIPQISAWHGKSILASSPLTSRWKLNSIKSRHDTDRIAR